MTSAAQAEFFGVILALLSERPDEWASDEYHMVHAASGIDIWIANAAYGLHVNVKGARINPSWLWKRRLRRAVDDCLAVRAINSLRHSAGTANA